MCSHIVVIARVSLQGPAQMCLAQGDDMVDTLATDRSDQPVTNKGDGGALLDGSANTTWFTTCATQR